MDVRISFDLREFHQRLCRAIGVRWSSYGVPGGSALLTSSRLSSTERFCFEYLSDSLLSKFDDGKSSAEKRAAAMEKFHLAEQICSRINEGLTTTGLAPYEHEINRAIYICGLILGRFDWNDASERFGFGPGATTRLPRRLSDLAYKYSGKPETTTGNLALAAACLKREPLWLRSAGVSQETPVDEMFKLVAGNKVTTVPKSYKTDRAIAVEPDMNVFVQKGIGSLIRGRLRKVGLDLNDQTRNQRLAGVGSLSGKLATIDLSMASDTVSRAVVELFLPPDWLLAMEHCRSHYGTLPCGTLIRYSKFSSMGNGFTFELESLIFFSLAVAFAHNSAEGTHRVSVYGDDIIIPADVAGPFCECLRMLGFIPNSDKTFVSGPFRESCGKHYFHGHDVTPFYIRRPVDRLSELFLLGNNLKRYVNRISAFTRPSILRELMLLYKWVVDHAPAAWRNPRIPDGFGDGAFFGSFEECSPSPASTRINGRNYPNSWEGFDCHILTSLKEADVRDGPEGLLIKALGQIRNRCPFLGHLEDSTPSFAEPLRGGRVRLQKVFIPLKFWGESNQVELVSRLRLTA